MIIQIANSVVRPFVFSSAQSIAFSFQERVIADGGVVEGYDCLVLDLHRLEVI
jgi:hypothetical protein